MLWLTTRKPSAYHSRDKSAERGRSFPFLARTPAGLSDRVSSLGKLGTISYGGRSPCHANTTIIYNLLPLIPSPSNLRLRIRAPLPWPLTPKPKLARARPPLSPARRKLSTRRRPS